MVSITLGRPTHGTTCLKKHHINLALPTHQYVHCSTHKCRQVKQEEPYKRQHRLEDGFKIVIIISDEKLAAKLNHIAQLK